MDYYKLLQLEREPFSNSPDPEYFFQSRQHLACLQKLELAIRLKRGLNVVIGDVGTGKTTLCRELIRKFAQEPDIETHLILDPSFETPAEILNLIYATFTGESGRRRLSDTQLKEGIKQYLFHKGVDENGIVVLIIDEGQKISAACLEILREFLNYETNTFKLLQIIIYAQPEFEAMLTAHENFSDRINVLHHLAPMNFGDTCRMIRYRLKISSSTPKPLNLYTRPALWAIYRFSRGYPRRIIHLCHQSVLAMIIQNRSRAGWALIRSCKQRMTPAAERSRPLLAVSAMALFAALMLVAVTPDYLAQHHRNPTARYFKVEMPSLPIPANQTSLAPDPQKDPEQPLLVSLPQPDPLSIPDAAQQKIGQTEQKTEPSTAVSQSAESAVPEQPNAAEPVPAPAEQPQPPQILGQINVLPGDTLGALVYRIYGTYRNRHLNALIEANPQIPDPNAIDLGDRIVFPPLRFNPVSAVCPCYWLILDHARSLPDALSRQTQLHTKTQDTVQIIGHWAPSTGMDFDLTIKGFFTSEQRARAHMEALPKPLADGSRIISGWPQDTQLYADPYGGGAR